MRSYIITYSYPAKYRGTYLIQGEDGIDASDKLKKYLEETHGGTTDSHCVVLEVEGSSIQIVGYSE